MAPRTLVALIAMVLPATLVGQDDFTLDLPTIMRGVETVGRAPENVRWTPDGAWLYFSWLPPGTDWREVSRPYRIRALAGAVPEPVTPAEMDSVAPLLASGIPMRDGRRRVVSSGGDLWLVGLPTGTLRRLTKTSSGEQLLGLSADERRVYYREGDNAHALTLANGFVEQLTDVRSGTAPSDPKPATGQRGALVRDQLDLFGAIRDEARRDSVRKAEREERMARSLPTTWLGKDARLRTLDLNATGSHAVVVASFSATPAAKVAIVPNYVTSSGYTEDLSTYAKVGDVEGRTRVGLLTVASGEIRWVRPIPDDSTEQYDGLRSWGWNDAGTAALLVAETTDNTRRVVSRLDVDSARITVVHTLTDSAWVDGPCGSCGGWLPGGAGFWYVSEESGYAHLYRQHADGTRQVLTGGDWEVLRVGLSDDRRRFELTTSEGSPYERHWYTMDLDGGNRLRLTGPVGGHDVTPSPDGRWLADVYSAANHPPELYLQEAKPGAALTRLTHSPTAAWESFAWIAPEIIEIPSDGGMMVPARIYRPEQMGARPNGAAVLFVHGAGYLHNVHHYWSSYFREYQFHHLLAAKGYVVLDLDYRGSAGYGRDWRTAIYRQMGHPELEDYVGASKWLTTTMGIPGDRIGIYGGSYGGFMTLMALFREPAYFGAGAALRSVTDWAHYNGGYTAPILNAPQEDSLAYRQSSPIYFAEGLEDPLLIAHGMIDTNVHFQDVVRLAQRLIELGKVRWELAVYPVENHGFTRPDSWTDEYRRILELFDRWLPDVQRTHE